MISGHYEDWMICILSPYNAISGGAGILCGLDEDRGFLGHQGSIGIAFKSKLGEVIQRCTAEDKNGFMWRSTSLRGERRRLSYLFLSTAVTLLLPSPS